MRNPTNYGKPKAEATLRRMLDLLATGPATTQELIAASGKSTCRARDYLMHLRTIGQAYCMVESVFSFDGSTPAVWELDPKFAGAPVVDDTVDQFPRRVVVRQEWAPNHVRMAMECLLFGVPKVLQGVGA